MGGGLVRLVTSTVLITNAAPGDWIIRSFLYEVPWGAGLGGMTIYLIGIAQTISQSKSVSGWLPSPTVVDIVGILALSAPVLVGIPLSFAAGAAAMKNDVVTAILLIRISYMAWFVWVSSISGSILYATVRLVRILKAHHKRHRRTSNYAAVMSGIRKIQFLAVTFALCLSGFAILLLLYCALRDQILVNKAGSIFAGAAWAFMGSTATLAAEISVIFRQIQIFISKHIQVNIDGSYNIVLV
ncbi:hypothetical protein BJV82DRAFT_505039 [Fennellomyces sp. T-0311]|nr:hypothetical protein BJV82DRAFT_505039 [Fennellomyces sp. T-0311]